MNLKISIAKLCEKTGMSRQNYYKGQTRRSRREVDSDLIEDLVRAERAVQPRLGGKKLHRLLRPELKKADVRIGRDRFFEVLGERGLLLEPLPKAPRTTNSRHSLPVFRNLLTDMELTGPNQAWVSDITYIRTDEGFLYLSLITDAWSRKIVGFHGGDTLETEGCLTALEKAVKELADGFSPLHHSDRGSQYASDDYQQLLKDQGIRCSMSRKGNCYDNAPMESFFATLKKELIHHEEYQTREEARQSIFEYIEVFYNRVRRHSALGYKSPDEFERAA